jgi:flagellar biosynthesis regulator FlbT
LLDIASSSAVDRDYYKTLKTLRLLIPREARLFAASLQ